MFKFIASGLVIAVFCIPAHSNDTIERLSASICEYVKSDDRTSIRKKLRSASLNLRHTYPGFVCQPEGDFNGGSLLKTAAYYGASEVSSFFIRKVSKSDIDMTEHDGKTTLQWMKEALSSGKVKDVQKGQSIFGEAEGRLGD